MIFDFELNGLTPILFHADDVEAADELGVWRNDSKNQDFSVKGDDRSPPWTWTTYLHHDGERVAIPQEVIQTALRVAGAKIPTGKKSNETFKKQSQSGLMIHAEFCEFAGSKGPVHIAEIDKFKREAFSVQARKVEALGFRLFTKRAAVGQSKHVRVRPRFDTWRVRGRIEILDPIITPDVLREMFDIAGEKAGLLDWRPSAKKSPGPFGKFEAKLTKAK